MKPTELPMQPITPADAQLLLRCAPPAVEVSFRVLSWASDMRSATYGPEAEVLEAGRSLNTLERGVENAALERLQAYLSDRTLDNVVVVMSSKDQDTPPPIEEILARIPLDAPHAKP